VKIKTRAHVTSQNISQLAHSYRVEDIKKILKRLLTSKEEGLLENWTCNLVLFLAFYHDVGAGRLSGRGAAIKVKHQPYNCTPKGQK